MMMWNNKYSTPLVLLSRLLVAPSTFTFNGVNAALVESERMEEYHRRGHTWPPAPEDYTPSTPGWQKIYEEYFKQLQYSGEEVPGERYQAYMGALHSAVLSKNFTQFGWGITKAPKGVVDKLYKRLHDGLQQEHKPLVHPNSCMETELLPYIFQDHQMNDEIVKELLPLHEAWSGIDLVPNNAYGLRVYRNNSNLLMHLDKPETHVISGILHVDHGVDDEPWPLVIEDFLGNTNEVYLETGDLLFYESSKCRHGRPTKYNGEFYSSLFMHFYPKEGWQTSDRVLDIHYRIPSHDIWQKAAGIEENSDINELTLVNLCMKEPECESEWCRLNDTVKWYGPGPGYGKVLSADGVFDLENIPDEKSFENIRTEL
jgi:hypothetical protein